jgi:hypothetical protein
LIEIDQLANELVEAQKVRSDLLKWKIALVAGLAGVGLGLVDTAPSGQRYADLVLCAIPLAAVYVDALCRHLSLRIKVIGDYRYSREGDDYRKYEEFVSRAREQGAFGLEGYTVVVSTVVICVALMLVPQSLDPELPHATAINISGAVGLVLAVIVEAVFLWLERRIKPLGGNRHEQPDR